MENVWLEVGVDSTSNANRRQTGHVNTSLWLLLVFLQCGLLNCLYFFVSLLFTSLVF